MDALAFLLVAVVARRLLLVVMAAVAAADLDAACLALAFFLALDDWKPNSSGLKAVICRLDVSTVAGVGEMPAASAAGTAWAVGGGAASSS